MCIALIGGMDRLGRNYINEAESFGIDLIVFTKYEKEMAAKIKNVDTVVIFTNKISHNAKREVMRIAKFHNIPVFMHHKCGICTLKNCLDCLIATINGKGGTNNV